MAGGVVWLEVEAARRAAGLFPSLRDDLEGENWLVVERGGKSGWSAWSVASEGSAEIWVSSVIRAAEGG